MQKRALGALLLAATLVMAGCGSQAASTPATTSTTAAPTTATSGTPAPNTAAPSTATPSTGATSAAAPSTVEVTVKMNEFSFDPGTVNIPLGSKVKITLVNEGSRNHNFNIQGPYDIQSDVLDPGKSQTISFTADKAGTFQIVCTQRGHKDKGMVATLIIK